MEYLNQLGTVFAFGGNKTFAMHVMQSVTPNRTPILGAESRVGGCSSGGSSTLFALDPLVYTSFEGKKN